MDYEKYVGKGVVQIMRKLFFASFLTLLVLSAVRGQEFSGVTGVVFDKSGAVISGVDVTLDNDKINFHLQTTTNEEGIYQFPHVPPGPGYKLTFSKVGFRKLEMSEVSLGVATISTRNATLELGEVTQFVEVKAPPTDTLNTSDASIGNVLGTQALENLPSLFRENPSGLLGLQAGVTPDAGGGANRAGAVTGSRTDQSNITIDGIDVNDQAGGFAYTTVGNAPIESIEEFRVTTANGLATDGRSAGGQMQLVTKGGTNDFHGSAYEFNRTAATAANDFFNNSAKVPRPALTRNQFGGSLGGPLRKDKLFFFFNYEGRRDASGNAAARTVPLDHVRNGGLAYVHTGNDAQGTACGSSARLNDPVTARCIIILPAPQVAALDPCSQAGGCPNASGFMAAGADPALMTVITGRYPHANDLTGGDGINTGFFRFNAPFRIDHNTYVTRMDYKITSKQSLFGKFNIVRESETHDVQQFPGDPPSQLFQDKTYTYVIGHTWTINTNNINSATFGVTRQLNNFPAGPGAFPTFPNEFTYGPYSGAFFNSFNIQSRTVPVPTIRDDYTMIHGKHTFGLGMNLRPIRQKSTLTNDFNFIGIGIGGNLSSLGPDGSSLRPSDFVALGPDPTERNEWDSAFTFLLGRFSNQLTNFNYNVQLQPQPPGTGKRRDFHYNEYEFYGQDSWKMRNDLTLTYGLRWSYYGVPFEVNGFETVPNVGLDQLFSTRVKNGANGISGPAAAPLLTYDLGGSANNAKGYYSPTWTNFGPRLGVAWNPSFKAGLLNSLFGDRKTTVRAGSSIVYDRVAGAVTFIADQLSFLFQNNNSQPFGQADPVASLETDPRFTSLTTPPVAVVPPVVTRPITPFVDSSGNPFGEGADEFIYAVDPKFKTPYEHVFGLSVQRELPANTLLEVDYVGRLGRRLFAESDGAQIVDFKDPGCAGCPFPGGQGLIAAFNNLATAVRAGQNPNTITPQPFFENQIFPGATDALAGSGLSSFLINGDISDFVVVLNSFGLLNPNIGLPGQAASITYVSSKSSSNYNGLLVVLRKRMSRGLQMDLDYTFSHSIDNTSSVVNVVDTGFVCDLRNLRVCRGNSDFDATHIISSNWLYDLPFGRSGYLGRGAPGWVDRIIGDWSVSGIWSWHTGFALSTATGSFPVGNFFGDVNGVPAVFGGNTAAVARKVHNENGVLEYFASQANAFGAFSFPFGGQIGNRNSLRGPGFWTVDLRLRKDIKMPWSEHQKLEFFAEAFNAFNHENFADPNTSITSAATFGALTATRGEGARQMQFALRYAF